MLTHHINKHHTKNTSAIKDDSRKRKIFERTRKNCPYYQGDAVVVNGVGGVVVDVYDDFRDVEWNNYMCRFVEVYLYSKNNRCCVFHPSELKRQARVYD